MGGVQRTNRCLASFLASRKSDTSKSSSRLDRRAFYARRPRVHDVRQAMVVLPCATRAERRIYTSVTDLCKKDGCFEVTRASFSLRELANQWNWSSERRRRAADLDELLRATIELSRLSARKARERERDENARSCCAIASLSCLSASWATYTDLTFIVLAALAAATSPNFQWLYIWYLWWLIIHDWTG